MKTAEKDKRESLRQSVLFALEVIAGKQANALKENDFIYHDRVPKYEDLELPDGKSLIKPIAFDPHDKSVLGEDLFAQLLPVTVIRSVSVYEEEKTKLKRKIGDKIAKKDEELDEYLLSLELGQINVDTEMDKLSLPAELLEASARFCSQPDAFAEILNKLYEVGDRSNLVEKTLKDLRVRVDSIDLPEVTSDDGYKAISRTLDQYQEMHSKYRDSNSDYQSAIAEQSELIRMLAMPLTELKKKLVGTVPKLDESEDGRTLKRILDKVDEMRMQRIKLYENFKGDLLRDDISGKLLADKHEDNKNLFDSELYKHDMNIALIEQNLTAQENILRALTEANAKYANVRQEAIEMAQKRSEQISELVNAYEVFTLVTNQAGKGMKFYDQLLTKSGGLAQSIQAMESMCQKEKERKRERQQKAEEKMRAMQLAKDTDETMAFFSTGSLNEHPAAFPAAPRPVLADKTSRPRLGDYMDFYRNKMGSVPSTPAVAPMKNGAQLPPKSYAAFGASLQPMANAYASQGYQMPANYYQQPMVPSSNAGNPSHIPTMFSASTNAPGISTSTPLQFPMPSLSAIGNPQLALPNRTPLPQPPTMPGTQFSMYQSPFAAPTGPQQPQFGNPSPFSATQNSGAINVSSNSPWHQNFPTNTRLQ
ncbi:hypothetical protein L596_008883 [Steinernema carpocapsae]|uniref:BRO1 domain-containing protein n=1 Tax=Steinernema carpocapsae TaxID=34508 RepID=A0A4U5PE07_STECR|nr:hypothetical protein L596_008883 [Steinernema carpocapsae]